MPTIRKKILAVLLGALAAVAVAEVALRAAGFSHPPFYRPDETRGWAPAPATSGWYTAEGRSWVETNAAGLREGELPLARPPGEYRIAVLGDSMTEGLQVAREATFVEVLERRLAACAALPPGYRDVEAINFGVSGYGTAQELLTLRHVALAYRPQLVVLAFYAGNDVANDERAIDGDPRRPYFELAGGELLLDDSFRDTRAHRLRTLPGIGLAYAAARHSRLLQLAAVIKTRLGQPAAALPAAGGEPPPSPSDAVYLAQPDEAWRRAWEVTEALVAASAAESRRAGAGFLLLTLSTGVQAHPDAALRRRFTASLAAVSPPGEAPADLLHPERRLAALARREGFDMLALAPRLARRAAAGGEPFHGAGGFGHYDAAGHRAVAGIVADDLCRRWARASDGGVAGGGPAAAGDGDGSGSLATAGGS